MKPKSPMDIELEKDKVEARRLARRVAYKRHKLHITQEDHAVNGLLDRSYISLIETQQRNPSFTNLRKIIEGLNETLESFFKDYYTEPTDSLLLKEDRASIDPTSYINITLLLLVVRS